VCADDHGIVAFESHRRNAGGASVERAAKLGHHLFENFRLMRDRKRIRRKVEIGPDALQVRPVGDVYAVDEVGLE
jgi:hypothetical protein